MSRGYTRTIGGGGEGSPKGDSNLSKGLELKFFCCSSLTRRMARMRTSFSAAESGQRKHFSVWRPAERDLSCPYYRFFLTPLVLFSELHHSCTSVRPLPLRQLP